MSKHRVLSLKLQLRLKRRGQDGQHEMNSPIRIPSAQAHHAFYIGTEALFIERERGRDCGVEDLGRD
jgi:hypothetical protein